MVVPLEAYRPCHRPCYRRLPLTRHSVSRSPIRTLGVLMTWTRRRASCLHIRSLRLLRTPKERLRGHEVGVPLEATRTRQRVAVARRVLRRTAVRTLLTRPRFRPDLDRDTVLLGGIRQPVDERPERPEIVRLCVRLHRPVRLQHVRQRSYVHCRNAFIVQAFDEVTGESVLGITQNQGESPRV